MVRRYLYSCVGCFVFLLVLGTGLTFAAQELKVGFVGGRGVDAEVEVQAFANAGIEYEALTAVDYKLERLLQFDVIGVGVVAYDQNEDLKANFKVLNEYIKSGGYVVTLDFQQDSTWDKAFLPHPVELFDDDLEEAAGVEIQDHPIWHTPNEITEENFVGWGAGDFTSDGPHEANPPWEVLIISAGWTIVIGAPAGNGYVVFSSLSTLQALGRTGNEVIADVMENLLFWRGPLAVEAKGKLASVWGGVKAR
ncbi:hypothetical protein ACFL6S_35680 [Candidatus Poribacteria bacterium]